MSRMSNIIQKLSNDDILKQIELSCHYITNGVIETEFDTTINDTNFDPLTEKQCEILQTDLDIDILSDVCKLYNLIIDEDANLMLNKIDHIIITKNDYPLVKINKKNNIGNNILEIDLGNLYKKLEEAHVNNKKDNMEFYLKSLGVLASISTIIVALKYLLK